MLAKKSNIVRTVLILAGLTFTACGRDHVAKLPDEAGREPASLDALYVGIPKYTPPQSGDVPTLTATERANILQKYSYLDPKRVVPRKMLENSILYFAANRATFPNDKVISVIDFAARSTEARFYMIDLKTGQVTRIHVADGKGSEPIHNGYAKYFSNDAGSGKSSLGFYRVSEAYNGEHGYSARFDGLSKTNSNVRARAIVLHGAPYVQEAAVVQGRSLGCTAVALSQHKAVVDRLSGGSLLFVSNQP